MKKLSIICSIILFVGLMTNPAFTAQILIDYLEPGNLVVGVVVA